MRRATPGRCYRRAHKQHFYPRSPCGERHDQVVVEAARYQFLSTLSLRRATLILSASSARAEISIHALLAESDARRGRPRYYIRISIHALLAESDASISARCVFSFIFLSTLSLRRATRPPEATDDHDGNFYPRSPCGERRGTKTAARQPFVISIHALLAESDSAAAARRPRPVDFYPRSPCGERPQPVFWATPTMPFLSTLSLRRATVVLFVHFCDITISIHALLAESDRQIAG